MSDFVEYVKPDYSMQWFHKLICDTLTRFSNGEIKKLMVFMPPQHGKSELTTRLFPSYMLGVNPDTKIAIASYSATLATRFNRDIQRVIDSQVYNDIFPDTYLNESNVVTVSDSYLRNSEIFEIVGRKGFLKAVGRGGSLTGTPIDIAIIDDPLKDRQEAMSITIREGLWSWYTDVLETRLHNNSQIIVILTRWHEEDLAGKILNRDNDWHIIKLPAIKENKDNDYDKRQLGEALWQEKHSLERMLSIKKNSINTFNSLYQQEPQPDPTGLIYNKKRAAPFQELEYVAYGLDYGFNPDPAALVKVSVDKRNKIVYVKELIYELEVGAERYNDILNKNTRRGEIILCDHDSVIYDYLIRRGHNLKKADKKDKAGRLATLREFEIVYEGKNIHKEIINYQFLDTKAGIPVDGNDHAMDAMIYAALFLLKPRAKSSNTAFLIN
jgi:hypothetical protein